MLRKNKAQIFSIDLFIAIGVFILVLVSISFAWDYSNEKIFLNEKREDLEIIARNAVSTLVETEGNPRDWDKLSIFEFNNTNVFSLGLVKNNFGLNVIDSKKIDKLIILNSTKYNEIKKIVGIIGPNYEFNLKFYIWDKDRYIDSFFIGMGIPSYIDNIVSIERICLVDNTIAKINIKVWSDE